MNRLKTVLIMAGGTGGHVFPGLAVAKCMQEQGISVHWLGTPQGLEARVVPEANIPIHYISIKGLRGKGLKTLLLAPFKLSIAVLQALHIIRRIKPDMVLGMGGFVSGPGGIASWLLKKPIVIHEQNAIPGLTNKCLAKVAKKVLQGFPETFKESSKNFLVVGNPVRPEITQLLSPEKRELDSKSSLRLLVLGGSLGAQAINELLPRALALLPANERPEVLHQAGEKHLEQTKKGYQALGVSATIVPFIQKMNNAYASADLVLCRSGALTVAELCAAGVGAILIPFPHAVDDHQTANGNFMVANEAAILIQQRDLSAEKLAAVIKDFYFHKEKCITMAKAAYSLRRVDATEKVVTICEEIGRELDI